MNDNNDENRMDGEHEFAPADTLAGAAPQPALALDEDERLPWLESADDEDEVGGIDAAKLARFVIFGVALLVLIVGGIWFANHRGTPEGQVAEGGVIPAPTEPYKSEPADKGGKTFAGTGDSAFAVSEGKNPSAKLGGADTPVPVPTASPLAASVPGTSAGSATSAAAAPAAGASSTGVGVQVGAYTSQSSAEAGWSRLVSAHDVLKGVKHRVVEGSADIGTVYRLQAVTPDGASANSLCAGLKAAGVPCQVKR